MQHMKAPFELACGINGGHILRPLHNTKQPIIPTRIRTAAAQLLLGQVAAARAFMHRLSQCEHCIGHPARHLWRLLQQPIGEALSRFFAHPRKARQVLHCASEVIH